MPRPRRGNNGRLCISSRQPGAHARPYLHAFANNAAAIRLYETIGFSLPGWNNVHRPVSRMTDLAATTAGSQMNGFLKKAALFLGIGALAVASYLVGIQLTGNFAAVVPGEVYRSSQPTAAAIVNYARRYGIRTIINLRGRHEKEAWYEEETATAKRLGIGLVDFPMVADRRLDVERAARLVAILKDAPRPILIHCRSGADRTGLASVIYLAKIAKVDEEMAERQLSVRYGHIGIPLLSPTYAMDESWEALETAGS